MNSLLEIQADTLASRIKAAAAGATVSAVGPYGYGKSAILGKVEQRLKLDGLVPILLAPPIEELDTGCAAITQLTDGLKSYGLLNGQSDEIRDKNKSWSYKFDLVKKWTTTNRDKVVLLCDEPYRWPIARAAEATHSSYSNEHTKQFTEWLSTECNCKRVVSRARIAGTRDTIAPHFMESYDLEQGVMDFARASMYEPVGKEILDIIPYAQLHPDKCGTLLVQFLIAYACLQSSAEAIKMVRQGLSYSKLIDGIVKALAKLENRSLREMLDTLALERDPIDSELVKQLSEKLSDKKSYVLVHCLLSRIGGKFAVPEALRVALLAQPRDRFQDRLRHKELMDFYLKAASSSLQANHSSLYLRFKAWYHGASIGDESILVDAYFVDQLHVLGRALSRDLGDHAAAVRVFKTCTELDSDDDYGHHYYAYNLDCLAEKRKEVSSSYQRAIQLNESHPWWWSRWINYLITTGNMRDAKIEWAKASENLGSKSGKAEEWVYTALHLWVARLALHRAQLDFVTDVLEDVPTSLMQVDTRFQAIRHHLEAMQIARESESVFPINIAPGTYWEKPHLDLPLTSHEGKRVNWYPARIAFVNKEFVGLIAGKHDSTSGRTDYGMVDLTRTLFDDASMDEKSDVIEEGRFVEIGFYGANEVMRIRVHPNEDFVDPNLPDFDPPNPRRYLDKQFEVA